MALCGMWFKAICGNSLHANVVGQKGACCYICIQPQPSTPPPAPRPYSLTLKTVKEMGKSFQKKDC